MMGRKNQEDGAKPMGYAKRGVIRATIDWKEYIGHFVRQKADSPKESFVTFGEKVQKDQLISSLASNLLQTKNGVSSELIKQYADAGSKESFIKTATLQLMSTPEYQLC
jgi:hypothetical protein